jgi:hypothetical protein
MFKRLSVLILALWFFTSPINAGRIKPPPPSPYKLTVHTGSYSIDYNNLTQTQINAHVDALVQAMPNVQYIAIGSHLDYPDQMRLWATAIHNKQRKVWFRSVGFNSWQGHNGVAATGTVDQHRADIVTWVGANYTMFKSGDIFEVVPDEPENGSYWYTTFSNGVGTNDLSKSQFNGFIQLTIEDVDRKLSQLGVTGVNTRYVFTNPSVSKDILTATTASMLNAIGTDDYPERLNGVPATTATESAELMHNEIVTWLLPAHPTKPKHLTIGPSIYVNLDPQTQSDVYTAELNQIKTDIPTLDGLTIWQSGATWNPNSRIFDYVGTSWVARPAAGTINSLFPTLFP